MTIKIFVSYAHADWQPRPNHESSRMSQLLDDIRHELRCHDTRGDFKLLRDSEGVVHGGDNLDLVIPKAIDEADIGLVFLSRSYVRSEECTGELRQILRKKKPVCLVELEHALTEEFVEEIRSQYPHFARVVSIGFWGIRDNQSTLFGWPLPSAQRKDDPEYYKALDFTVKSIEEMRHNILEKLHEDSYSALRNREDYTVFIASPTADVKREAERLKAALEEAGHSVLLFSYDRHISESANASQVLDLAIQKSTVLIQLLGGVPGGRWKGESLQSVPLQHELMKKSGKPYLIYEADYVNNEECGDDYSAFLLGLNAHKSLYEDFELFAAKQVDRVVADKKGFEKRTDIEPLVGVDFAESDLSIADAVMKAVGEHVVVDPLEYDLDHERLEQIVADSDGIIFVFGESSAGRKRTGAHFRIIQRYRNRSHGNHFIVAVGSGIDPDSNGTTSLLPRGPSVHMITVNTERCEVDADSLSRFVAGVRETAAKRFQSIGV